MKWEDKHGNTIVMKADENGKKKITLILRKEERPRSLGYLFKGVWHIRKNPEKHFFEKSQSYGFNEEVVKKLPEETIVQVAEVKGAVLETTVGIIKAKGGYLHFLENGLEKQIFLKRSEFKVIKEKKVPKMSTKDVENDEMF